MPFDDGDSFGPSSSIQSDLGSSPPPFYHAPQNTQETEPSHSELPPELSSWDNIFATLEQTQDDLHYNINLPTSDSTEGELQNVSAVRSNVCVPVEQNTAKQSDVDFPDASRIACDFQDCTATFKRKSDMTRHKKWKHACVRRPKCNICSKNFSRPDLVIRHKKESHTKDRA